MNRRMRSSQLKPPVRAYTLYNLFLTYCFSVFLKIVDNFFSELFMSFSLVSFRFRFSRFLYSILSLILLLSFRINPQHDSFAMILSLILFILTLYPMIMLVLFFTSIHPFHFWELYSFTSFLCFALHFYWVYFFWFWIFITLSINP